VEKIEPAKMAYPLIEQGLEEYKKKMRKGGRRKK